jgi:hypothetical protein
MIPEETFQPIIHDAVVIDVSERGAMVKVQTSEETVRALLRATRYCRLSFHHHPDLPEKVIGKAVWIQPESRGETVFCRLGLYFDESSGEVVAKLGEFVNKMLQTQASPPEAR